MQIFSSSSWCFIFPSLPAVSAFLPLLIVFSLNVQSSFFYIWFFIQALAVIRLFSLYPNSYLSLPSLFSSSLFAMKIRFTAKNISSGIFRVTVIHSIEAKKTFWWPLFKMIDLLFPQISCIIFSLLGISQFWYDDYFISGYAGIILSDTTSVLVLHFTLCITRAIRMRKVAFNSSGWPHADIWALFYIWNS